MPDCPHCRPPLTSDRAEVQRLRRVIRETLLAFDRNSAGRPVMFGPDERRRIEDKLWDALDTRERR